MKILMIAMLMMSFSGLSVAQDNDTGFCNEDRVTEDKIDKFCQENPNQCEEKDGKKVPKSGVVVE